jgi:hypothetical protein
VDDGFGVRNDQNQWMSLGEAAWLTPRLCLYRAEMTPSMSSTASPVCGSRSPSNAVSADVLPYRSSTTAADNKPHKTQHAPSHPQLLTIPPRLAVCRAVELKEPLYAWNPGWRPA